MLTARGWMPVEQSPYAAPWRKAFMDDPRYDGIYGGYQPGIYVLSQGTLVLTRGL